MGNRFPSILFIIFGVFQKVGGQVKKILEKIFGGNFKVLSLWVIFFHGKKLKKKILEKILMNFKNCPYICKKFGDEAFKYSGRIYRKSDERAW